MQAKPASVALGYFCMVSQIRQPPTNEGGMKQCRQTPRKPALQFISQHQPNQTDERLETARISKNLTHLCRRVTRYAHLFPKIAE